jgi:cytochrome b involved in lipid metabolism
VDFDNVIVKWSIIITLVILFLLSGGLIVNLSGSSNQKLAENALKPEVRQYSLDDISKHYTRKDCWVYLNGTVYDASPIIAANPEYATELLSVCGKDGSDVYTVKKYQEQKIEREEITRLNNELLSNKKGILAP